MVTLLSEIEAAADTLVEWRRYFHRYPEPSLQEHNTAATIRSILTNLAIPFDTVGETGTLGYINGTKASATPEQQNRTVLLRADIDALEITEASGAEYTSENEGIMHACGHDAHTTALIGAAYYLINHTQEFAGTVLLAFQQAEEIGAGAKQFVQSGLIDHADIAFGMHVDPHVPYGQIVTVPGPLHASCDIFTIEVFGQSAHVARPHQGADALLAGANIVTEIQNIVARQVDPIEPAVIGIGKFEAGTRYNIVANHGKIEGTLRALSHETRAALLSRIEEVAKATASIHGCTVEFSNYDAAAPVINNSEATARAQNVAEELVGEENVISYQKPSMGADDFADYQLMMPGIYTRIGINSSQETSFGLHHECFNLDERVLPLMANYHVSFALSFLNE